MRTLRRSVPKIGVGIEFEMTLYFMNVFGTKFEVQNKNPQFKLTTISTTTIVNNNTKDSITYSIEKEIASKGYDT
jgi:hypothetical protein